MPPRARWRLTPAGASARSMASPRISWDPPISLTVVGGVGGAVTAASIWLPFFSNTVGSVSGIGTETLNLRLLHSSSYLLTSSNATTFAINPNVPVSLVINTPYAEAWAAYLATQLSFTGLWTCLPAPICTGTYSPGVSLGQVTITIPATNLVALN